MIDWVTAKIPFSYPGIISDGEMMSITRDGEIEYSLRKRLSVRGSYDGSITLRTTQVDSDRNTVEVELSGNPVKFLQGHNLFGSDDLLNLVAAVVLRLSDIIKCPQPPSFFNSVLKGFYTISRVDINTMYTLDSRSEVNAYLYALGQQTRTRNQGSIVKGSTVYLNKDSRRWSFKFYGKAQESELKRNIKQGTIDLPKALKDWVQPMLRAELTLKSNELRSVHLHLGANWHTIETQNLFTDYAERIQMSAQNSTTNPAELLKVIKLKAAVSTFQLWADGNDVRAILTKPTFYRHRAELLKHGVDISMPPPKKEDLPNNVVPFTKTLELKPAVLPYWVDGTHLYFEPRKLCKEA